MSHLSQRLADAADKNRELLAVLAETDYAAPALKQNATYIKDLQAQIASTDKELKRLHSLTEDERKEHVKIRDSVMKRYAHKLGGHKSQEKFASKQEKEEREFLEAWQREREMQETREQLSAALETAQGEMRKQSADGSKHDQAQAALDQLYESLFSGPTPEIPLEDRMEDAVKQARNWFQQCEASAGSESHALGALGTAGQYLSAALNYMGSARGHSQMDMIGGGMFSDMMERDALLQAQNNLTQCLRIMDEARRAQPSIPQLTEVNIDHGHMLSDVFFDNIFTDMAQHDRIKDSQAQMQRATGHLQTITTEQQQRTRDARSQLKQASGQLEEARVELQRTRSEAFEQFAGRDAPPAYEA